MHQAIRFLDRNLDTLLYVSWSMLSTTSAAVSMGQLDKRWAFPVALVCSGVQAWKLKRSKGAGDPLPPVSKPDP